MNVNTDLPVVSNLSEFSDSVINKYYFVELYDRLQNLLIVKF